MAMASINGDAQTDTGLDRPLKLAPSCSSKKDLNGDDDDDDDDDDLDFLSPRVFPKPSQSNKERTRQARKQRYQGITTKGGDQEALRMNEKIKNPAWIEDQGNNNDQCKVLIDVIKISYSFCRSFS